MNGDYLQAKRISLQPGVYQTARGSLAIPAYDADGKRVQRPLA